MRWRTKLKDGSYMMSEERSMAFDDDDAPREIDKLERSLTEVTNKSFFSLDAGDLRSIGIGNRDRKSNSHRDLIQKTQDKTQTQGIKPYYKDI